MQRRNAQFCELKGLRPAQTHSPQLRTHSVFCLEYPQIQNLKYLLLSGCEGKQKHQMAAEKTTDNESGWEVWNDRAGLCQGSCSCLRATVQSWGWEMESLSWGWEMGSPELDPCRRWSQSTQPLPHRLHHPCPADCWHCTVLPHLPGALCWHLFVTQGSQLAGTTPSPACVGCGVPRAVLRWERGWSSSEGMDLGFLELGAHTSHGTGVGAGLKSTRHLAAPPWDGTANSTLLRQQRL